MGETNQKKNKILIVFLSLLVLILAGYIAYDRITSNNRNQDNNKQIDKNNDNEENEDLSEIKFGEEKEIINQIVGDWGRCKGTSCNGIEIRKDENDIYYYTFYIPSAGGFREARVLYDPKKLENNKYEITGYYQATSANSIYGENPEKEEKLVVDMSKISSNIIVVNNIEYEKIKTTRENFYDSRITQEKEKINQIVGDWGRCKGTSCNGIEIRKEENDTYYYTFYIPSAGGFREARVLYEPKKLENNKYEITGYYQATSANSIYGENPEKEEKLVVDMSKISSNIIVVNNIEYEKIKGNREEFYNFKQN